MHIQAHTHAHAHTHTHTHAHTHTHTNTQKVKQNKDCNCCTASHAYPDKLGNLCTKQIPESVQTNPPGDGTSAPQQGCGCCMDDGMGTQDPPEPHPLSETCTAWHLLPQLLQGSHYTAGWTGEMWVKFLAQWNNNRNWASLSIEPGTFRLPVQCSNHLTDAASHKHTHTHTRTHINTHTHTHTNTHTHKH